MLSKVDQELIDGALGLAGSAGIDPAKALQNLAQINERLTTLRERLRRGGAGYRIYTVPFVGQVIVASTGITGIGQTVIPWAKNGRIVGMKACIAEGAAPSHVTLGLKDENQYSFFTNGTNDAFVSLETFQGNVYDQGGWYPFLEGIEIKANSQWYAQASSSDVLPLSGSTSYTPLVYFLVDENAQTKGS